MSKNCFVYLIQSGCKVKDPIKVGMANNPERRIKELQTGNPVKLRTVLLIECDSRKHALRLEQTLHHMLRGHNILGEWFKPVRSNVFKAINEIANNPDYNQVKNEVGLFAPPSDEQRIEMKAQKRLQSLVNVGRMEERLRREEKEKNAHMLAMESKLTQRRKEAGILYKMILDSTEMSMLEIYQAIGRKE